MTIVTGRTLTISGSYLLKRAKDLARKLLRFNQNNKIEVVDGYLIQAKRSPTGATGIVIDPPGALMVFDALLDSRGNKYPAGQRDYFDSRVGLTNGPYGYADITPTEAQTQVVAFGFNPDDTSPLSPWLNAVRWRNSVIANRDTLRQNALRIAPPSGTGYPFDDFDQVPLGTVVFSGTSVYPDSTNRPGYWWGESSIANLAPGYSLMARTTLGYMSFQYQGMQPTTSSHDNVTLMVFPLVKNLDPTQAVHWGHSALLFVLLDYAGNQTEGLPTIVWSQVWTPDAHDITFFHNGPWQAEPSGNIASFFAAPQDSWERFWGDWETAGRPNPAGGSQPNWTDAISACWFNGRFVVNVRCCALNGALSAPSMGFPDKYEVAGGSAHVRFTVVPTGGLTVEQVQYDIWDSPGSNFGITYPYDVWVAGHLDINTIYGVNPVATLMMGTSLVEVRWRMEADRQNPLYASGTGPYMPAYFDTGRYEFTITPVDEDGNELTPVVHDVVFDTLGAGVQGPTTRLVDTLVMLPPTASYKLWSMNPMVVALSDHEIGFVCYEEWDDYFPTRLTPVKLAVLNTTTGVAEVRSDIGFDHDPKVGYEQPVHISCAQETRYNDEGDITIEGVLFASGAMTPLVRISRDSGRTWQDYLTFPQAQTGAYYVGSPLAVGKRPGAAIN